jgi:hypothetical protein
MAEPISAVARFGPEGLMGTASLGRFHGISDVLIQAPSQRVFAVSLRPDGSFTLSESDLLSTGQFVAGTVLSDLQQKRQAIYKRLLTESKVGRRTNDSLLMASADPIDFPFTFESDAREAGSAILSAPLEIQRTEPNVRVTVPRAFMPYRRVLSLGVAQPNMEGQQAIEQNLRFQVPQSVLPFKLEKARLFANVDIPLRRFTVRGYSDKGPVELRSVQSPVDDLEIEITREDVLSLDSQGGFHLDINVSEQTPKGEEIPPPWIIHSLEIEIIGQTLE